MEDEKKTTTIGEPSPFMRQAQAATPAVAGDVSFEYEGITIAQPEAGIFPVVGGYMDDDGKLHNVVQMRSMTGDEEDLWMDENSPFVVLCNETLSRCVTRYGSITNPGQIRQAVLRSPQGTRIDMLISLRTFSHYNTVGSIYKMSVECGSRKCRQNHAEPFVVDVDLSTIGRYESPNPGQNEYTVKLPGSGQDVIWKRMTSAGDQIVEAVRGEQNLKKEVSTWGIMVRLMRIDGEDLSIGLDDVLDKSGRAVLGYGVRGRISRRGLDCHKAIKKMTSEDREYLRAQFLEHEPTLDLEVEAECPTCKYLNRTGLDVSQRGFFFPQATAALTKRTFSFSSTSGG